MLGPEVVVRSCEIVAPGFDAAPRRAVAAVPLHDRQPAGARPVPRPVRLVGARTARPARAAVGRRPVRRRARLRVVLPQGTRRIVDSRARVLDSRWYDEGDGVLRYEIRADVVLLADGARHRRHAGGGRRGQTPARARCSRCCAPPTAIPRANSRRRAACASGTSATEPVVYVARERDRPVGSSPAVAGGVKSESEGSSNLVTMNAVVSSPSSSVREISSSTPVSLSMQ